MVEKVDAVLDHAQTVVIGTKDPDFQSVPGAHANSQVLVDFVRIDNHRCEKEKYDGICW